MQQQSLTCKSKIEKAYYNVDGRKLKLEDVCIHCGNGGTSAFLRCQPELEAENMTGGKLCYPICIDCIKEGKKPVQYTKKKINQTKKRKEVAANKTAAKHAKKAGKSGRANVARGGKRKSTESCNDF